MRTINFHLKHQNPLYIKAHQAMLNATALDNSYAELMYRADILGYKESFASFCHTNHYQIVKDSLNEITVPTNAFMFSPESEVGYDVSSDYIKGE